MHLLILVFYKEGGVGSCILLFEIFLCFKVMQKVIEIKHYSLAVQEFPCLRWFVFGGGKIEDWLERREVFCYKWLSNGFLFLLFFSAIIIDSDEIILIDLIKTTFSLFAFTLFRAWPHIKVISNSIASR